MLYFLPKIPIKTNGEHLINFLSSINIGSCTKSGYYIWYHKAYHKKQSKNNTSASVEFNAIAKIIIICYTIKVLKNFGRAEIIL